MGAVPGRSTRSLDSAMAEAPDKRVWYFFVPAVATAALDIAIPSSSAASHVVAPLVYVAFAALGVGVGVLSIASGYSLLRPSITAADARFLYWAEITMCFVFAAVALWKLIGAINGAV